MPSGQLLNLTDEFKQEFVRLWTNTNLTRVEISRFLEKRHGVSLTPVQLSDQAKRLQAFRGHPGINRATVEDRIRRASLARSNRIPSEDNAVVPVPPATFRYSGGFRLGGGVS